jgi:hypothetical protein
MLRLPHGVHITWAETDVVTLQCRRCDLTLVSELLDLLRTVMAKTREERHVIVLVTVSNLSSQMNPVHACDSTTAATSNDDEQPNA